MKRTVFALVSVALLAGVPPHAAAEPIRYTDMFRASGTFGGTAFTDESVVLSITADTSDIFFGDLPGLLGNSGVGTVEVSGVGMATFTNLMQVLEVQPFELLTFADVAEGPMFGHFNPAFASYDLASALGPLTRATQPFINPAQVLPTDRGGFSLMFATSPLITFTASPVPEPSSLVLLGAGLIGLLGRHLRHRRS